MFDGERVENVRRIVASLDRAAEVQEQLANSLPESSELRGASFLTAGAYKLTATMIRVALGDLQVPGTDDEDA